MAFDPSLFDIATATLVIALLATLIRIVVFAKRDFTHIAEKVAIGFSIFSFLLIIATYVLTRIKIRRENERLASDGTLSAIYVRRSLD